MPDAPIDPRTLITHPTGEYARFAELLAQFRAGRVQSVLMDNDGVCALVADLFFDGVWSRAAPGDAAAVFGARRPPPSPAS